MTLSPEQLEEIAADQARINAEQIALGGKENQLVVAKFRKLEKSTQALDRHQLTEEQRRWLEDDYVLEPAYMNLEPDEPIEYAVDGFIERGATAGIVAPPESGKSLIALNIAACVATGKPFHGREVEQGLVVYLLGEGRSGMKRRLQALENHYKLGIKRGTPLFFSRTSAPILDPKECARITAKIQLCEEIYGDGLQLLIIDTLSRFIAPGKDSASEDMSAYFNAVDQLRGYAAAITLHHPGHMEKQRGRGSSVWAGALDAEFNISKAGDQKSGEIITLTCSKMKDGEKPDPFSYRIKTGPSSTIDRDGNVIQSVFLEPTEQIVSSARATGKNQVALARVAAEYKSETGKDLISGIELRERARAAKIDRRRFLEASTALERCGLLTPAVGGWRIGD